MGRRKGHIVVTGAAGFLGGHVTTVLRARGYEITALDDLSTGAAEGADAADLFVRLDLRDRSALYALLSNKHTDAVVHLAGCRAPDRARTDPARTAELNLGGTASLLGAMRPANVRRIVLGSSLAVYGDPGPVSVSERDAPAPIDPYGRIALAAESILADCAAAWGLVATTARLAELGGDRIGDRPEGRAGRGLVDRLLRSARRNHHRRPFVVEGVRDEEGTFRPRVVDLLHVRDAAAGLADLLGRSLQGESGGLFNLSSGLGAPLDTLTETMRRVSGRDFPVVEGPLPDGLPLARVALSERLRRETGWRPERSDPETILADAWASD